MITSDGGPEANVAGAQLTHEVERLANELFRGTGPAPYAANVGAGGASPQALVPVTVHDVPLATAAGTTPALDLPPPVPSGTPYFLDIAGMPAAPAPPPTHAQAHPPGPVPSAHSPTMPGASTPPIHTQAHPPGSVSSAHSPTTPGASTPPGLARPSVSQPGAAAYPGATTDGNLPGAGGGASSGGPGQSATAPNVASPTTTTTTASGASSPDRTTPASAPVHGYEFRPELVPELRVAPGIFDAHAVKRDFPILDQQVNGRPLVWLDNAATTQKPKVVIDRVSFYYEHENSNIHRAAHTLAARATDAYEGARQQVRRFLNASSPDEIVFVRGATEGINLVAQSWGRRNIEPGDEILITWLEHHANIVPWQQLCSEKGARLRVAPVDDTGQIILEEYERLLGSRTRIVSLPQVSNALGTILPAKEMVEMAHRRGAHVLVDGAQAVSHMPVDVQLLDCDFYVFSGHKIFAPTGIGVVYGKKDLLATMPPWQGGGNMIADVTFAKTTYQGPPARFEAGTGSIADAVGLGAALEYLSGLGLPKVERHEHELRVYAEGCLAQIPGLRLIGTAPEKAGVISFVLDNVRTEDVSGLLDLEGIAVRSGHHCAQPILRRFGLESTVRASLAPYNTREDIDALVVAVRRLQLGRPGEIRRSASS
jgi:cysteine desulfurase / selenocysteine lyase